jgi:hypothetical protein
MHPSRRDFCKTSLTAIAGWSFSSTTGFAGETPKKKVAAIVVGYSLRWHADNIVTRLLEGYWINDRYYEPSCQLVSLYVYRSSKTDISQRLSDAYGFRISATIADALTLGTANLAVDGVVIVSEDGGIAFQKNPYFLFFSQIVEVFQKSGKSVPVFNDKQLSHDWNEVKWMVQQSRELRFPLLAGSSVPVTFRRPELDFAKGTRFEEALVAATLPNAYVESIGFHGLELLQAMVERRFGGETGVRAVQCLEGKAVWEAAEKGVWSRALFDAAVARSASRSEGRAEALITHPVALLVEYKDGLRGSVIGASGLVRDFNFAARIQGENEILSTLAYIPWENSNNFSCLVYYIERMMITGKPDYPVERTLLTSGTLDFLMRSRREDHKRLETAELNVAYQAPVESVFCRGAGS